MSTLANRRILLIDDMPAIHADFRKILAAETPSAALNDAEAALFGSATPPEFAAFELDSVHQGHEGVAKIEQSLQTDRPYAMAFVDMRMPPGWDGVETIEHMWRVDPRVQVVICTAYSDYLWEDVLKRLDVRDRLLILKKPFDMIEVRQLAQALTAKWDSTQQAVLKMDRLDLAVQERTREMLHTQDLLQIEIKERQQLENQLIQLEKLASVGQLAAGIAHEINNPIGFIFSNFSALETYLDKLFEMLTAYENAEQSGHSPAQAAQLKDLRERLEVEFLKTDIPLLMGESKDGLTRISKIIQGLKDFSRMDQGQTWEWADLHLGIDSTLTIIASEIKYCADVVKEYGHIPLVECLPSQLNQVIMNLVVNAAHASKDQRGQITIRTGVDGEQVWIEVEDQGSGITAEALPRIFDPFFTTKPIGKGTGLGLSMSHGIVQKHNGRIGVQTAVGKGTTFRIVLPTRHTPASV